jgi:hypothetical protein
VNCVILPILDSIYCSGLLYTAFALGDMYQLYFAILIQMLVMQLVGNVTAVVSPLVEKFQFNRKVAQGQKLSWADVLVENDPYDTFGDFNEIVIQFGYVMFFSAAFPAAAVLSWFNNFIEIRLDASSVLNNEPRPSAERKGGIGVWFEIIELMSFAAVVINALIYALTSDAIGAATHNLCNYAFQDIDVTVNPSHLTSLSWYQQGCVSFCSGMYQSQKFHNPKVYVGFCGTRPVIDPVTHLAYPSCKTIPNKDGPVECTEKDPCPEASGPAGALSLSNNCNSPFLCNPIPLHVPVRSPRSLYNKNATADWSRAYCQESPRINLGSGEWRYDKPTPFYAHNPFLNNFPSNSNGGIQGIPSYVDTKTNDYGHIACTLLCAKDVVCPYHKTNPTFNPELRRQQSYKPMDYISPAQLQEIQAARDVKCEKKGNNFVVPEGKGKYCFLCASEELGLTVPVIGADNFNEIVFTTSFGPSVGVLWSVLVFEHIVFAIKFFVMSLVYPPFAAHCPFFICILAICVFNHAAFLSSLIIFCNTSE